MVPLVEVLPVSEIGRVLEHPKLEKPITAFGAQEILYCLLRRGAGLRPVFILNAFSKFCLNHLIFGKL